MSLLRRCRVNAALTIQLFSQLFHFINMWLFNKLVLEPKLGMVNRLWGMRLRRRLNRVEVWAEKQGLELAADCHLARIIQATNLLQTPKHSPDDIAELCTTCYKLNSIQLRFLLEQYQPEPGELLRVPQDVIERAINVARNTADELTRSEHREVTLAEDADLQLPFLLPEDGYSCDIIKGIPQGLADFLEPVMADGLCRLTPLPSQTGSWQTFMMELDEFSQEEDRMSAGPPDHMEPPNPREPEIIQIQLQKVQGSMGLSIVAAKGESQPSKGIYIKSVVPGGAADRDGRLQAGDQLLEVDGKSLIGLSQERAADFMKDTGQVVDLRVAKQGAIYHGLATLLSQPTPPMSRSGQIPPPQDNQTYMTQSKSTSVLSGPDNSFSKPAPQFMSQPDDLRSKSQGNLLRDEEKSKWQPAARGPQPIDPSRAASQPNLDRGDSPNYQNYPDSLVPNQRPVSQYRENIPAPQSPQGNNFPTNRPRSEFVDPNWYPPPPADLPRQPIYQNQVPGKPPHRYDDRDLPPPPDDHLPPPINNNISPPGSDYVNYQVNGGPARFGNEQAQFQKPSRGDSQSGLPAQPLPSTYDQRQKPAEPPKPAAEPPWARGSGQAQPPRPSVPPTTAAPSVAPSVRPYGQGPRAPQPGDIMRPQPVVQPYRPPQPPADSDGFRQQDSFRGGPRGPPQMEMNKAQPPTNGLPQTAYNQGQPMYPPPNQPGVPQNQTIRGNRPPIPQQMIQNQMVANTNSMWQNDPRRIGDERRELREGAIRELESKPYRSSEEEERLGRLRLDSEFERRADLARTEDSRDSDEDQRNMSYSSSAIPNRFQQPASGAIPGGSMGSGPMPGPRGPGSMVGGPMGPGPMSAGPMSAGPMGPGPISGGPMGQGPMSAGPMGPGPMSAGPMGPGPMSAGPMGPGPMSAGPMGPGPMSAGPMGSGPMSGGSMGQQQPPQPRRPGPAMTGPSPPTQPITLPVNNQIDVPAAVKRDILQSKTVTFKPAYREDTMRSRPEVPDSSRTGQVNTQQDFQRQQRELREKQRRESTDGRQSLIRQEEEEMRRRRDYEIMQRKDSERIHMQPMNDVQQRYADQPPMQHRQNAGPVPQRAYYYD